MIVSSEQFQFEMIDASISEMENNCPVFFRNKHGKRETYTTYKGGLIVRNTDSYTGKRNTTIYLYGKYVDDTNKFTTNHIGSASGIPQAKRIIDKIISTGKYRD